MALRKVLTNEDIDYGSPIDERMSGMRTPTSSSAPIVSEKPISFCPEGQKYLGKNVLGKPLCSANIRYRNKDKQAAYEKLQVEKANLEKGLESAEDSLMSSMEEMGNTLSEVGQGDNLLKKYWWVLAAIGVYIIISND
jgi:hypothetical protein